MASTKKTTRKPAAKRNPPAPEVKKTPWRELMGVVLFGLGALLVCFMWFSQGRSGIGDFMIGAAGSLRHLCPIILFYAGIVLIFYANKPARRGRFVLEGIFVFLFFTLFHVFSADAIVDGMQFYNYPNFVSKSIAHGTGGGFLGALFSWPLYWGLNLGTVGAATVLIFAMIGILILMGKISLTKMSERMESGFYDIREARSQRAQEFPDLMAGESRPKKQHVSAMDTPEYDQKPLRSMKIERITESAAVIPRIPPTNAGEEVGTEDAAGIPEFLAPIRKRKGKAVAPAVNIEQPKELSLATDGIAIFTPYGAAGDNPEATEYEEEPSEEPESYDEPVDFDLAAFEAVDPFEEIAAAEPPTKKEPVKKEPPVKAEPRPEPAKEAPEEEYFYPPIDLLEKSQPSKIKNQEQKDLEKAQKLIETLKSFGIAVSLIGIAHGPTVTRFELSPAAGIKVSRITSLADDIALGLAAISVRIEAPIPGKAAVGVEVPNDISEAVPLRDVLESSEARKYPSRIAAALGRDNAGNNIVADLAKMPHLLIAGATGAGKSVCINCLICSILYRATPEEVRMIMIDPKVVELSAYNGIPHLLVPVVTDPKKAAEALSWAVLEMGKRYGQFSALGVRDIKGYNSRRPDGEPAMPQIVLVIDELADLMMVTPGEVEDAICRLAQLARAAGIHLVIATQRPSVNVITGVIKANIPSRIAFTVASQVDSRTILDIGGAEKLLGRGDMLYAPSGTNKPLRVQGAWISDEEVHKVVEYIKARHDAEYDADIIEKMDRAEMSDAEREDADDEYDELLPQAIETVIEVGQASISMLQRKLRIGYARAGRLIDEMTRRGVVSEADGAKPRTVLISRDQYNTMFGE